MKRDEWLFQFSNVELATAAKKKLAEHSHKLAWWENKKAETMKKIKESGIEIHDSVASTYSNTKGEFGPQIKIDAGLQRDLTECQTKIRQHFEFIKSYDGWAQVLSGVTDPVLRLDHEDWLFFFGGGNWPAKAESVDKPDAPA